jgi:hypothetical protein
MTGVPEHPGRTPLKSRLQNPSKKPFKKSKFLFTLRIFRESGGLLQIIKVL